MLHNTLEQDMLLEALEKDCRHWISNNRKIFLNEHDMQGSLASYLMQSKHYEGVYVEYPVPFESLKTAAETNPRTPIVFDKKDKSTFPWKEDLFIDIVVEKAGKFAAVELKYATALLDPQTVDKKASTVTVFGKKTPINMVDVIKKTGAYDNKRYDYWKDVRRIEALTRFQNVAGGIALMVTNDSIYWTTPKDNEKPDYAAFSMREAKTMEPGKLDWKRKNTTTSKKTRHAFHLDGSYYCHWEKTQIPALARDKTVRKDKNERSFHYMMSVIHPQKHKTANSRK